VLEGNAEAGRKLLLSGSGQCNFTNALSPGEFLRVCRRAGPFLKPSIYAYGSVFFRELLQKAGCPSLVREDGKVFPLSLDAADVRDALVRAALNAGTAFQFRTLVTGVEIVPDGFIVRAGAEVYHSPRLLLACGGASWPQTGSRGDGYAFAKKLGHTVNPIRPALANVETEEGAFFASCAGVSLPQVQTVFLTASGRHAAAGSLLFTHTGLSGPVILDNSHLLSAGDTVRLRLIPQAETLVRQVLSAGGKKTASNALKPLPLPASLINAILGLAGIPASTKASALTPQTVNRIIGFLDSLPLGISQVESLRTCMSTAGGVPLAEVDARTMQSRLVPGLFLAGEMLDYALPTGGFNIQAAFSTGFLAGLRMSVKPA